MNIMVVDDDTSLSEALLEHLSFRGHQVTTAGCGAETLEGCSVRRPDLVILDRCLPDASGVQLIPKFKETVRGIRVVMLTGFPDVRDAVEAGQKGVEAYLAKPVDLAELDHCIAMGAEPAARPPAELTVGPGLPLYGPDLYQVLGSGAMRRVYDHIRKAARVKSVPVLVSGETGTGKKHVAELIHACSGGGSGPFIDIDCAGIPETLFESELFGYEAGAFTDARKAKPGRLEQARGGVAFLDEIGELPLGVQSKLLKAIDQKKVRKLGAQTETSTASSSTVAASTVAAAQAPVASTQQVAQAQSTATQMVAITQKQNAAQEKSDNSFLGNFLNNSKLAQNTGAATANAIGSSFANFVAEAKAGTLTVAGAFEQLGSSIGQAVVGAIGDTLIEMGAGDLTKGATAILKGNFAGSGGLLAAGAMESAAGGAIKGVGATGRFPLRLGRARISVTTLAVRQGWLAEAA